MRKFYSPFIVVGLFMFCAVSGFAQGLVKGKVIDAVTKETLPGASISIKGTQKSTSTTLNGNFSIKVETADAELVISYVGYLQKSVSVSNVSGTKDIGNVALESSAALSEVVVTANNVAIDRKTPIAISTVGYVQIEEKGSNQEFPELLKSTPGVYATKAGGGFGDSRINLRGFQSANIAVMINGVPVNDMENGRVFWSNWAGLTDVTRSMQVQRGLGASKVAVPSVGGTINIITRSTDAQKGGFIYQGIGNNEWNKTAFSYSTGLSDKGWAFSVLGSKNTGNGWAEGLYFESYSYFFNASRKINSKHTLSLTGFGNKQYHAQRFDNLTIETYRNAPQGIKYNPNWGVLNGEVKTISGNFFHKPQASLNHYWTINDKSSLSTAIYYSIGTGGNEYDNSSANFDSYKTGDFYSPIALDALVDQNVSASDGKAVAYLQSQRNNHKWYGLLSTYQRKLTDDINLLAGLDLRRYKGIHYNSVRNLLNSNYVLDQWTTTTPTVGDINNPINMAKTGDKIAFYNDGLVFWQGGFLQGEYSRGPLSAFASGALSNTSYKRIDYFRYLNTDPLRETDWQNFLGFQTKGGANYNITEHHNVFANLGYFSKAPFFNAVFLSNQNVPNKDAENEKISSYELGYGYRSSIFTANVNLYRTKWLDRSLTRSLVDPATNARYSANLLNVDALHQGIELDFRYKPFQNLTLSGMASIGDWTWLNDLEKVEVFNEAGGKVGDIGPVLSKGLKVGDAAQTTASLGLDFNISKELKIGANYNYYGDYWAQFDPTALVEADLKPWKVPNYSLLDLNAVFRFKIAGTNASLFANVNNVLNTEYISDANALFRRVDNGPDISDASNATVFYGFGRTWTTGLKVNF